MSDDAILDRLYEWSTGYLEDLTPCNQEARTYADAVREVAASMAAATAPSVLDCLAHLAVLT